MGPEKAIKIINIHKNNLKFKLQLYRHYTYI